MQQQATRPPVWQSTIARTILEKRYLMRDEHGNVTEEPETLFRRVATTIAAAEKNYGATDEEVAQRAEQFFTLMAYGLFEPNTPTLTNAGRDLGMLSACFVLPVEDDLGGIYETMKHAALIHQAGGGTGFAFSRLRPNGDIVRSTMGIASGPISFMTVYDQSTEAIKQGGTRRGANMGILQCTHPDILQFITCKSDTSKITNFNISIAITNDFMYAVEHDLTYDLINPRTRQVHLAGKDGLKHPVSGEVLVPAGQPTRLRARMVFDLIVQNAHATGEPGLFFIDHANAANPVPHLGSYEATNPCVTGDTRLHTQYGLVRMDELYRRKALLQVTVDSRACSESKGGESRGVVIRPAVPVFLSSDDADVYRVVTSHGYEIRATDWHDFYTTRGKIKLRDLQPGDTLMVQSAAGQWGHEGTYDLGLLTGVIAGSGHVTSDRGVVINLWDEDRVLSHHLVDSINDLVKDLPVGHHPDYLVRAVDVPERCLTTIRSVRLARIVGEYGITETTIQRVPELIWRGSRETVVGYLQGLFQTCGALEISGEDEPCAVRLASDSVALLKDVQMVLANFGIFCTVQVYHPQQAQNGSSDSGPTRGRANNKRYQQQQAGYELIIVDESRARFMHDIGFRNSHTQDIYRAWSSEHTTMSPQQPFTTTITAVVYEGREPVYDTTQHDDNAVIFNGLVTGQCGEQPLLPYDVCNLGSINLAAFVTEDGDIDWDELRTVTHLATRFLDNVIDVNHYPLPQIADLNRRIRRIGLGVMGWADMLVRLDVPYNSARAVELAREMMGFVDREAKVASEQLADERGVFPDWEQSIWGPDQTCARTRDGRRVQPTKRLRNCNLTTVAPTGTISMIAGCSSGIEPLFAVAFWRYQAESRMLDTNPDFLARARDEGWYSEDLMERIATTGHIHHPEVPHEVQHTWVTAHDIIPEWHVRMQAAFQEYTDSAISKTINFAHAATPDDVRAAYHLAYRLGCKGITVYRDGSRSNQVLSTGSSASSSSTTSTTSAAAPPQEAKATPPAELTPQAVPRGALPAYSYPVDTPQGKLRMFVTEVDGKPFEVFATIGRAGSDVMAFTEALGRLLSLGLRCGIPVRLLAEQMRGIGGNRSTGFGPERVRSVPDAIGKVLLERYVPEDEESPNNYTHITASSNGHNGYPTGESSFADWQILVEQQDVSISGEICPKCQNATLINTEGCRSCYACGYTEC